MHMFTNDAFTFKLTHWLWPTILFFTHKNRHRINIVNIKCILIHQNIGHFHWLQVEGAHTKWIGTPIITLIKSSSFTNSKGRKFVSRWISSMFVFTGYWLAINIIIHSSQQKCLFSAEFLTYDCTAHPYDNMYSGSDTWQYYYYGPHSTVTGTRSVN